MIKIIDCGSQYTQNIARRIRDLGVYSEIIPFSTLSNKLDTADLEGIVISGGQFSVYDDGSPTLQKEIFELGVPILGICYGHQLLAYMLRGIVKPTPKREYGGTEVEIENDGLIFSGIPEKKFKVWMSHGDIVEEVPKGFRVIARSQNGHIAAMQGNRIFSVQFHPEVDHTNYGREILDNFLSFCNVQRIWNAENKYNNLISKLQNELISKVGIGGVSGGVDSTVASILINRIVGNSYHPIFVNNGLLRLGEAEQVLSTLESLGLNVTYIDVTDNFLSKLKGVTDSDEKRKIIGHEFIAVFEEVARKIPNASYLVQGTLYPDVIESVPVYGSSSKIKRHHNVGGLPEKLGLRIVEPFREMFKDEVREIAEHAEHNLNLPREVTWRHPFPGPGLAIRIKGEVTPEKLRIVREADAIFIEELKNRGLYFKINQAFAEILCGETIGIMGDIGTSDFSIGLRAVVTKDFMTADRYRFKDDDIDAITSRILNEVKGVSRVFYDLSPKPPSTIELE